MAFSRANTTRKEYPFSRIRIHLESEFRVQSVQAVRQPQFRVSYLGGPLPLLTLGGLRLVRTWGN